MKTYKCPFCKKSYSHKEKSEAKKALYEHIEREHPEQVKDMSPAQVAFNYRNNKKGGKCVICGKPTKFNDMTERYERFCSERCRQKYREQFKERMKKKYGKTHLLDDAKQQKKMLANREISGEYKWQNEEARGHKTQYTGSYEREFIEFMDLMMNWENPEDLMGPAPQVFDYNGPDGKKRFYIPDFYITSLNLIVEIKGSSSDNTHEWRKRELEKEKIKDKILKKSKYDYIKIVDRNYEVFWDYLLKLKNK